jgi:hypothetical protein
VCGILAALIGLGWVVLAWLIQEAASAIVLPMMMMAAGVITFLIGRGMAKAHAGSRD